MDGFTPQNWAILLDFPKHLPTTEDMARELLTIITKPLDRSIEVEKEDQEEPEGKH